MGMGHVPQDPIHSECAGVEFQRCECRRTSERRNPEPNGVVKHTRAKAARGAWAERKVAEWYVARGYEILAMNWRLRTEQARGEIDIVAMKDSVLVVCEVKARANEDFGDPLEAITPRKQFLLQRAAYEFVREHNLRYSRIRFDAAAVTGVSLRVECDAF
jgi:putative endonuclease